MIDATDALILSILQADARTSNAEIARRVGMAPSAVFDRIRRLEERGIIRGYTAVIAPPAAGMGLLAFVLVAGIDGQSCTDLGARLAEIPGVQEVHHIAGNDDYLVKIRARDPESLGHLLRDSFRAIPGLRSTRTVVVLDTILESSHLPFGGPAVEPVPGRGGLTAEEPCSTSLPPTPPAQVPPHTLPPGARRRGAPSAPSTGTTGGLETPVRSGSKRGRSRGG